MGFLYIYKKKDKKTTTHTPLRYVYSVSKEERIYTCNLYHIG